MATATERQSTIIEPIDEKRQKEADLWLEMAALFIHDLESPLASMKYLLKVINSDKLDLQKPAHRKLVKSSQVALDRAEMILYDILSIARSGKVGLPVDLKKLDPRPVIEDAITLAQGSAAENGIRVVIDGELPSIAVMADATLTKRALDNLFYNAIRHTPQGGVISCKVEITERTILIHIKDSGPGLGDIEPNILFEKYGQIQLRAAGRHRGVGLGLYFCRLAATVMGGTVIAADHPDGGAVFTLRLMKAGEKLV